MSGMDPGGRAGSAPSAVPRLEIRVLGPVEVAWDGSLIDIGGVKARALVARLLVDRNIVVSADALADSLWGEQDGSNAGQIALRSTVSRLRKRIRAAGGPEDVIVTRSPGYVLAIGPEVTDAHRFEQLVTAGRQALRDRRPADAARLFAEAESLWRGQAYWEVCDEPFARAEARRLDELRLSAVETRIDAELTLGGHAALAGELESLTSAHPLRERLWSQRMLALYRAGRQAEALRVFQELRRILVAELGIEPGHDVTWMEQAILTQDPALDFPVPPEGGAAPRRAPGTAASGTRPHGIRALTLPEDTPFVGRARELAQLRGWWESVQTSEWRALLVNGDAGVGKTRLVAEFAGELEAEGVVVLWGRCDEDPVMPFEPFAEVLGRYYETQSADRISAMPQWQLAELSGLVPRLREFARFSEEEGDPEVERYRFFVAVTETIKALVTSGKVLLVIDDAHWFDQPTLLLLRHVVRGVAGPGFGFLGTYADAEVRPEDPLWPVLADGRARNRVETVHLEGLDAHGVEELTKTWTKAPVEMVPKLCELTDGNPLFLEELLRQFHEQTEMFDASGEPPVSAELTPTEAIRELVARRVSRLPEDVIYLLQAAAVAGREFEAAIAAEAAGLTAGQMLDAFDRAERSRLLRRTDARNERYAFTHALVRDAIYDELLRGRRVRYHHRIATAIERAHTGDLDDFVNELAFHYSMGAPVEDVDKALHYCVAAGERAMQLLAFEEAVMHFSRGLEVVERLGSSQPGTRCDLLLALAEAQNRAGDRDGAGETLVGAAELARQIGDAERLAAVALRSGPPSYLGRVLPDARQAELLEEAEAALPREDSRLRAMVLARLGQVVTPDPGTSPRAALARSRTLNTEAVAMARRLGDPAVLGHVLSARMQTLWDVAPSRERLATSIEIGEIAEETGDERLRLQSCVWRVRELLVTGAMDAVKDELAALESGDAGPVDPVEMSFRHSGATLRAFLAGDIGEAERRAHRCFESMQGFGDYARTIYASLLWWTWWQQGAFASPAHQIRTILESSYGEPATSFAMWGLVHAEAHETVEAIEQLQKVSDLGWPDPESDLTEGVTTAIAAAACSSVGAPAGQLVERVYEALRPFAGLALVHRGPVVSCAGPADHYLGLLAHLRGDLALAEVHFEAALDLARRMQAAPFAVAAEVELARVLRQRRPDEEAGRVAVLLRDAEESALAMGLYRLAHLAAEPG